MAAEGNVHPTILLKRFSVEVPTSLETNQIRQTPAQNSEKKEKVLKVPQLCGGLLHSPGKLKKNPRGQ